MPAIEKQVSLEEYIKEHNAIVEALAKPIAKVPMVDSLLGAPVNGFEGIYWHTIEGDETEAGIIKAMSGVRIPSTVHIPTGSKTSYRKVWKVINGVKTPVWEVHQRNLDISTHEPYDLE